VGKWIINAKIVEKDRNDLIRKYLILEEAVLFNYLIYSKKGLLACGSGATLQTWKCCPLLFK